MSTAEPSSPLDNGEKPGPRPSRWRRRSAATVAAVLLVTATGAGAAGAIIGVRFKGGGPGGNGAQLRCDGGMSRLSHIFDENASVFPGDPPPVITIVATVAEDGFLVEQVDTGTHTGTHIDAPGHFIEGGRTVDELEADELVWPAYVIDVRARMAEDGPDFQLTPADIRRVERRQGTIPQGAMVILRTGFDEVFGTPAYDEPVPGFSGDAVQWLFDKRDIGGIGSDTFGPDATSDADFAATYTALLNDGVVLPGLNNLASLNPNGDLIISGAVRLRDGSGYQVDPLACHRD